MPALTRKKIVQETEPSNGSVSYQQMSQSISDTLKSISSLALAFGRIVMLKLDVIEIYWSVDQSLNQFKGKIAQNGDHFLPSLLSSALYIISKLVKRATFQR